jgi:hypothetical protein
MASVIWSRRLVRASISVRKFAESESESVSELESGSGVGFVLGSVLERGAVAVARFGLGADRGLDGVEFGAPVGVVGAVVALCAADRAGDEPGWRCGGRSSSCSTGRPWSAPSRKKAAS